MDKFLTKSKQKSPATKRGNEDISSNEEKVKNAEIIEINSQDQSEQELEVGKNGKKSRQEEFVEKNKEEKKKTKNLKTEKKKKAGFRFLFRILRNQPKLSKFHSRSRKRSLKLST